MSCAFRGYTRQPLGCQVRFEAIFATAKCTENEYCLATHMTISKSTHGGNLRFLTGTDKQRGLKIGPRARDHRDSAGKEQLQAHFLSFNFVYTTHLLTRLAGVDCGRVGGLRVQLLKDETSQES